MATLIQAITGRAPGAQKKHEATIRHLEQRAQDIKAADRSLDEQQATVHVNIQKQVKSCADILNV